MHDSMRIALVADLHGNAVALAALTAALQQDACDRVVCLGDVAIFGPQPIEVLEGVQNAGWPVVMGNTDAWALESIPHPYRDAQTPMLNAIELWGAQKLTPEHRDFIRTFAPTYRCELPGGGEMLCCHGSPRSFHEVIMATTPDENLEEMLAGEQPTLLAYGHTHTPLLRRFGPTTLVNPGSAGLPFLLVEGTKRVRNPAWAEYAIIDATSRRVGIEFRQAPFDAEACRAAALTSGMPYAERWARSWS